MNQTTGEGARIVLRANSAKPWRWSVQQMSNHKTTGAETTVDDGRVIRFLGFTYVRLGIIRQLTFRGRWVFAKCGPMWNFHFFKRVQQ